MSEEDKVRPIREKDLTTDYEAPAIEQVVTQNELEREVHYAGLSSRNLG